MVVVSIHCPTSSCLRCGSRSEGMAEWGCGQYENLVWGLFLLLAVSVQPQCDTHSRGNSPARASTPTPLLRLQRMESFAWTSCSLVESPWLQHLMRSSYVIDLDEWFVYLADQSCSYKLPRTQWNVKRRQSAPLSDGCKLRHYSAADLQGFRKSKATGLQWHFVTSESALSHFLSLSLLLPLPLSLSCSTRISCPHVPTRLVHLTKMVLPDEIVSQIIWSVCRVLDATLEKKTKKQNGCICTLFYSCSMKASSLSNAWNIQI